MHTYPFSYRVQRTRVWALADDVTTMHLLRKKASEFGKMLALYVTSKGPLPSPSLLQKPGALGFQFSGGLRSSAGSLPSVLLALVSCLALSPNGPTWPRQA